MKSKKYKPIPISVAKQISKKYNKQQVIIVTWDDNHKLTHVTTYGDTLINCEQAAKGGHFVKKALGWPEEMCNDIPQRLNKKKNASKQ